MAESEFEKRLKFSSVPLVRLDEHNVPNRIASGALIDYGGRRLLLTVEHATGDQKKWAVQVKYVPGKGTQNHVIGALNFLAMGSLAAPDAELEVVDFAYAELPHNFRACRQEIEFPGKIKSKDPVTVHTPSLTDLPLSGENYGFCGLVLPTREEHFGKVYIERVPRVYSGLSYVRTEKNFHYFSLQFAHPGHEHFKGCSGAPVLSEKGAFVGLLCGPGKGANELRVISIRAQKTPIDILVGKI